MLRLSAIYRKIKVRVNRGYGKHRELKKIQLYQDNTSSSMLCMLRSIRTYPPQNSLIDHNLFASSDLWLKYFDRFTLIYPHSDKVCPVNDLISKFGIFIKLSQGCELTENCTFTGILKWWVTLKIKIEEASAFRLTFLSIIMILIHVVFFFMPAWNYLVLHQRLVIFSLVNS